MTQSNASEIADAALGQSIFVDHKEYKQKDLSEETKLIVANILEARNLQAIKEVEHKHIGISIQALEAGLKARLEGVPFTEMAEEE